MWKRLVSNVQIDRCFFQKLSFFLNFFIVNYHFYFKNDPCDSWSFWSLKWSIFVRIQILKIVQIGRCIPKIIIFQFFILNYRFYFKIGLFYSVMIIFISKIANFLSKMVFFHENDMKLEQKFQKLGLKFQKYFFRKWVIFWRYFCCIMQNMFLNRRRTSIVGLVLVGRFGLFELVWFIPQWFWSFSVNIVRLWNLKT